MIEHLHVRIANLENSEVTYFLYKGLQL